MFAFGALAVAALVGSWPQQAPLKLAAVAAAVADILNGITTPLTFRLRLQSRLGLVELGGQLEQTLLVIVCPAQLGAPVHLAHSYK
jgi:hypothetical protein